MDPEAQLRALRERIDALDAQLQQLIAERAVLAGEVAKAKLEAGDETLFYRPEREAQILRRVKERDSGPLPPDEMARLFREIMSACLALEQPLRVAYFGPAGSYTHTAALKHFGGSVTAVPLAAIDEVFREVEAGSADYGVVPVENSSEGLVTHTHDMFVRSGLRICGEINLRIHHNLLSHAQELAAVRRVYAHGQALAQCREWLDANLAHAERVPASNNAEGARRAAAETDAAAIAGDSAGEIYDLPALARNIEDDPGNTTRFLVVGDVDVPASGDDKCSLLLATRNQAGALYKLLEPLARHGVSMTRIESRPSRQAQWEYVYFIDLLGHRSDPTVAAALAELEGEASLLKILGAYPRAVL